jgi:hypothetical protein
MVMRAVYVLIMCAVSAAAQPVGEAEAARARRLLASPQWLDKAWGAYFAGRLHAAELREPLIEAFRETAALRDAAPVTEAYGYLAALFDAAIESGITVPAATLEPFEEKWSAPVIILLSREPAAAEEALLRMRAAAKRNSDWLAAGNLLAALKSERFFAKALSEVSVWQAFRVTDPGDLTGSGGGAGGGGFSDGVAVMPKRFPPVGVYQLSNWMKPGDALLTLGPQDIYYRRTVVPTDVQVSYSHAEYFIDRPKMSVDYLAPLAGLTVEQAQSVFHRQTRIEYSGEATLQREWDAAMSAQEAAIRAFVRAAQDHGLGRVTGMTLRIVPQLYDTRKTTRGGVPALTPREFVLE